MDPTTNQLASMAREAAFRVHRKLGPGLLESAYEACLAYEMAGMGLRFERQVEVPLTYGEVLLDVGFRLDFWVEKRVILEVKAVESLTPVHTAQIITYLRLTGNRLGYLVNFNVRFLKHGIRRIILSS